MHHQINEWHSFGRGKPGLAAIGQCPLGREAVSALDDLGHQAFFVLATQVILQDDKRLRIPGQERQSRSWCNSWQQCLRQSGVGRVVTLALGGEVHQILALFALVHDLVKTAARWHPAHGVGHTITPPLNAQVRHGLGDVMQQRSKEDHVSPLIALRINDFDGTALGQQIRIAPCH